MPDLDYGNREKTLLTSPVVDYDADPVWRSKPLTPAQILVQDLRLGKRLRRGQATLETTERLASSLIPGLAAVTPPAALHRASNAATNPIERQRFIDLEKDFGWLRHLRLPQYQTKTDDPPESARCRWIHCSSKFPEYLHGFLWALSDDMETISESTQLLTRAISQQTRHSKHGKYFAPFFQPLRRLTNCVCGETYPLLIAVPFLDWSILGATPPLRFQVDRREGFASSRSSAHLLRSLLQYYYRLEDTDDRESSQVFAKHKPWTTNRDLDLKIRQFYGHHPTSMNVDELWILVIDIDHIVTFSSNQTWKARWPPLQLTTRISDVAFRDIRSEFLTFGDNEEYTAMTHLVTCLSGAVGILHRSFWADIILPATDRYAGYLGHLQYRLHRSPSTKLVMDLIACQDELNIVIQLTQQQIELITLLQSTLGYGDNFTSRTNMIDSSFMQRTSIHKNHTAESELKETSSLQFEPSYRKDHNVGISSKSFIPLGQVLDKLKHELTDLTDLRDNTDRLVTRTIQLVNIRLEDHGKAILVFTIITIIFLPLNFVSSFFGMNFVGIRNTDQTQWLFWAVAMCVTAGVLAASIFFAFFGANILEKIHLWRDKRREARPDSNSTIKKTILDRLDGL